MSYGGTSTSVTVPARPEPAKAEAFATPCRPGCQCLRLPCPEPAKVNGSATKVPAANVKPSANGFPSTLDGRPDFARMDVPSGWRTSRPARASVADRSDRTGWEGVALARLDLVGVEKTFPGGVAAIRGRPGGRGRRAVP